MKTNNTYLHFVAYKMLGMWDVKRYGFKGRTFSNAVRLRDVLRPFDKSVSTEMLLKNNWAIISKINFSGDLFLRDVDDAKTFKGKLHIVDGDTLIYSKINVRHGCIYYHANSEMPFAVSSEYPAYKLDTTRIYGSYLVRILQSSYFKQALGIKATGISKARVKPDEFLDIQIPLPSLAEQQALVDAYNHNLQQATDLEQQAENGEKEIEEIVNGRLGLIKPMDKHGKTLPQLQFISYKDTLSRWDPFNVQQGITSSYPIHPLKDIITSIRTGTTPPTSHKEYFNGNIKFYTPADIGTSMYLTYAERSLAQPALVAKKVRLFYKGELLFVGIGSTVGKIGVVSDQRVSSNQQITGFSVDSTLVSPEFVYCYMHCNKDITTTERTKTTIPVVNQEKIEQIPIPIPPLDVQAEIVAEVQAQRAKIAEYKTTAVTLRQEAITQFEQAIFK